MSTGLSPGTRERVLDRFGFTSPPTTDLDGLCRLYQAWCRQVPFDNVRKLIALHGEGQDGPLPGMDADDFLTAWLRHGTGGTCWPSANALGALCTASGFSTRLIAASMADIGIPTHGTTVVTLGTAEWLVDSSMLTDEPLRLARDAGTEIARPAFATRATPVDEGWLFAFPLPYTTDQMPCRTISPEAVSHGFFVERYEASREASPFNTTVSTRRNDDEGVVSYGGGKRFRRTTDGIDESDLQGDALDRALVDELGFSGEIVERLRGALTDRP